MQLAMGKEKTVDSYRYLGIHLTDRLHWKTSSGAVYKKGMGRLYSLWKLRCFNVYSKMVAVFYLCVVLVRISVRLTGGRLCLLDDCVKTSLTLQLFWIVPGLHWSVSVKIGPRREQWLTIIKESNIYEKSTIKPNVTVLTQESCNKNFDSIYN